MRNSDDRASFERLLEKQYSATKHFSSEQLFEADSKIHDFYQEYADCHPDVLPEEIVQRLAFGILIKGHPRDAQASLLKEFMSSNLAEIYVWMVRERRELQLTGRFHCAYSYR